MVDDDYMPTDAEIREHFLWSIPDRNEKRAEKAFDRWLAAHDAALLESLSARVTQAETEKAASVHEAWDEGLTAGADRWMDSREFGDPPVNPYPAPDSSPGTGNEASE